MRQLKPKPALLLQPGEPPIRIAIPEDLDVMTKTVGATEVTWERVQAGNVTFWVDENGLAKGLRQCCVVQRSYALLIPYITLLGPVIVFARGAKTHADTEREFAKWATR